MKELFQNGEYRRALTRRTFMKLSALVGIIVALPGCIRRILNETSSSAANDTGQIDILLNVNNQPHHLLLEPRVTLLDALRERLSLTGTKKSCDHGQCGACTVLVDGQRINSCLALAVMYDGAKITTVEGLAQGNDLHPLQSAFIKHDAFQCGYCTPGQLCSAVGLLAENHAHTDEGIRELMSGNICRCGAYPNIVAAIREVRDLHTT